VIRRKSNAWRMLIPLVTVGSIGLAWLCFWPVKHGCSTLSNRLSCVIVERSFAGIELPLGTTYIVLVGALLVVLLASGYMTFIAHIRTSTGEAN
jgi:hypothetical protein